MAKFHLFATDYAVAKGHLFATHNAVASVLIFNDTLIIPNFTFFSLSLHYSLTRILCLRSVLAHTQPPPATAFSGEDIPTPASITLFCFYLFLNCTVLSPSLSLNPKMDLSPSLHHKPAPFTLIVTQSGDQLTLMW